MRQTQQDIQMRKFLTNTQKVAKKPNQELDFSQSPLFESSKDLQTSKKLPKGFSNNQMDLLARSLTSQLATPGPSIKSARTEDQQTLTTLTKTRNSGIMVSYSSRTPLLHEPSLQNIDKSTAVIQNKKTVKRKTSQQDILPRKRNLSKNSSLAPDYFRNNLRKDIQNRIDTRLKIVKEKKTKKVSRSPPRKSLHRRYKTFIEQDNLSTALVSGLSVRLRSRDSDPQSISSITRPSSQQRFEKHSFLEKQKEENKTTEPKTSVNTSFLSKFMTNKKEDDQETNYTRKIQELETQHEQVVVRLEKKLEFQQQKNLKLLQSISQRKDVISRQKFELSDLQAVNNQLNEKVHGLELVQEQLKAELIEAHRQLFELRQNTFSAQKPAPNTTVTSRSYGVPRNVNSPRNRQRSVDLERSYELGTSAQEICGANNLVLQDLNILHPIEQSQESEKQTSPAFSTMIASEHEHAQPSTRSDLERAQPSVMLVSEIEQANQSDTVKSVLTDAHVLDFTQQAFVSDGISEVKKITDARDNQILPFYYTPSMKSLFDKAYEQDKSSEGKSRISFETIPEEPLDLKLSKKVLAFAISRAQIQRSLNKLLKKQVSENDQIKLERTFLLQNFSNLQQKQSQTEQNFHTSQSEIVNLQKQILSQLLSKGIANRMHIKKTETLSNQLSTESQSVKTLKDQLLSVQLLSDTTFKEQKVLSSQLYKKVLGLLLSKGICTRIQALKQSQVVKYTQKVGRQLIAFNIESSMKQQHLEEHKKVTVVERDNALEVIKSLKIQHEQELNSKEADNQQLRSNMQQLQKASRENILCLSKKLIAEAIAKTQANRVLKSQVDQLLKGEKELSIDVVKYAMAKGIQKRCVKKKENVIQNTLESLNKTIIQLQKTQETSDLQSVKLQKMEKSVHDLQEENKSVNKILQVTQNVKEQESQQHKNESDALNRKVVSAAIARGIKKRTLTNEINQISRVHKEEQEKKDRLIVQDQANQANDKRVAQEKEEYLSKKIVALMLKNGLKNRKLNQSKEKVQNLQQNIQLNTFKENLIERELQEQAQKLRQKVVGVAIKNAMKRRSLKREAKAMKINAKQMLEKQNRMESEMQKNQQEFQVKEKAFNKQVVALYLRKGQQKRANQTLKSERNAITDRNQLQIQESQKLEEHANSLRKKVVAFAVSKAIQRRTSSVNIQSLNEESQQKDKQFENFNELLKVENNKLQELHDSLNASFALQTQQNFDLHQYKDQQLSKLMLKILGFAISRNFTKKSLQKSQQTTLALGYSQADLQNDLSQSQLSLQQAQITIQDKMTIIQQEQSTRHSLQIAHDTLVSQLSEAKSTQSNSEQQHKSNYLSVCKKVLSICFVKGIQFRQYQVELTKLKVLFSMLQKQATIQNNAKDQVERHNSQLQRRIVGYAVNRGISNREKQLQQTLNAKIKQQVKMYETQLVKSEQQIEIKKQLMEEKQKLIESNWQVEGNFMRKQIVSYAISKAMQKRSYQTRKAQLMIDLQKKEEKISQAQNVTAEITKKMDECTVELNQAQDLIVKIEKQINKKTVAQLLYSGIKKRMTQSRQSKLDQMSDCLNQAQTQVQTMQDNFETYASNLRKKFVACTMAKQFQKNSLNAQIFSMSKKSTDLQNELLTANENQSCTQRSKQRVLFELKFVKMLFQKAAEQAWGTQRLREFSDLKGLLAQEKLTLENMRQDYEDKQKEILTIFTEQHSETQKLTQQDKQNKAKIQDQLKQIDKLKKDLQIEVSQHKKFQEKIKSQEAEQEEEFQAQIDIMQKQFEQKKDEMATLKTKKEKAEGKLNFLTKSTHYLCKRVTKMAVVIAMRALSSKRQLTEQDKVSKSAQDEFKTTTEAYLLQIESLQEQKNEAQIKASQVQDHSDQLQSTQQLQMSKLMRKIVGLYISRGFKQRKSLLDLKQSTVQSKNLNNQNNNLVQSLSTLQQQNEFERQQLLLETKQSTEKTLLEQKNLENQLQGHRQKLVAIAMFKSMVQRRMQKELDSEKSQVKEQSQALKLLQQKVTQSEQIQESQAQKIDCLKEQEKKTQVENESLQGQVDSLEKQAIKDMRFRIGHFILVGTLKRRFVETFMNQAIMEDEQDLQVESKKVREKHLQEITELKDDYQAQIKGLMEEKKQKTQQIEELKNQFTQINPESKNAKEDNSQQECKQNRRLVCLIMRSGILKRQVKSLQDQLIHVNGALETMDELKSILQEDLSSELRNELIQSIHQKSPQHAQKIQLLTSPMSAGHFDKLRLLASPMHSPNIGQLFAQKQGSEEKLKKVVKQPKQEEKSEDSGKSN